MRVAAHLGSIRRLLRESITAQSSAYPTALTVPQVQVLELLADRSRAGLGGPSIRELSVGLGLSHSTVSGIVDRLERARIVQRSLDPDDRRRRRIELTEAARGWIERRLPRERARPLAAALARASAAERRSVLEGLAILESLLSVASREAGRHPAPRRAARSEVSRASG